LTLNQIKTVHSLINENSVYGGVVAISDNWQRYEFVETITSLVPDFNFITTIHPEAILGKGITIGSGTVILASSVINANSYIGVFCILNTNSSLDHDGYMDDFSSLASRASVGGNFFLGRFSAICMGTNIIGSIRIEEHTVVGAGSLVVNNIASKIFSFGIPAKKIRNRSIGEPYLDIKGNYLLPFIK